MSPTFDTLKLYAGPKARAHIAAHGLRASDVGAIPAAAGGPKGLILGPLDRFVFGRWLPLSNQPVHLIGASIGAWRMATACLADPQAALERLEHAYIHQDYAVEPGKKRPTAAHISERFGAGLRQFYSGQVEGLLAHPRYRLHVLTARGRHILRGAGRIATPLGFLGAASFNAASRRAQGIWLERVVFSSSPGLPFATHDYKTRQVALTPENFADAVQASCSIPFVLEPIQNIAGAPPGAYWDGGLTDYHLHLHYTIENVAKNDQNSPTSIVFYPHFQKAVVPGWLDKALKWRHKATPALDAMVVAAPNPDWVRAVLPRGKLPDRSDFTHFSTDLAARVAEWTAATAAAQQLADEFADFVSLSPSAQAARVEAL